MQDETGKELPAWTRMGWGDHGQAEPEHWRKKVSGQWARGHMTQYGHASPEYRLRFYVCAECGSELAPLRRDYRFGCRGCGLIFGTGGGTLWGYETGHQKAESAAPEDFL